MGNTGIKSGNSLHVKDFFWELVEEGSIVSSVTSALQPFRIHSVITKYCREKGFWHGMSGVCIS